MFNDNRALCDRLHKIYSAKILTADGISLGTVYAETEHEVLEYAKHKMDWLGGKHYKVSLSQVEVRKCLEQNMCTT